MLCEKLDLRFFTSILASLFLFIPLLIYGPFESLTISKYSEKFESVENKLFIISCASCSIPLIMDMIIESTFHTSQFILLRVSSISIIILTYLPQLIIMKHSIYGPTIGLILISWGYYAEFCVISSFLYELCPDIFTFTGTNILTGLFFIISTTPIIAALSVSSLQLPITMCFYISLPLFLLIYTVLSYRFFSFLYQLYREDSLSTSIAFNIWFKSLSAAQHTSAIIIILAFNFFIIIIVFPPLFINGDNIFKKSRFNINAFHVFLCMITYLVPSRLFRLNSSDQKEMDIKTELVKFISHEMRTPMGIINVGIDLISTEIDKTDIDKEKVKDYAVDVKDATLSVVDLLNDLQMYEKLERQNIRMKLRELNIISVISRIMNGYRADYINITPFISRDMSPEIPQRLLFVDIDTSKLKTVMNSLLYAAFNSTNESGTISIDFNIVYRQNIKKSRKETGIRNVIQPLIVDDYCIEVNILDNRSGLRLEDVQQLLSDTLILERVGHGDQTGRGFALWIARKLIQFHNANISAEKSRYCEGILFRLRFPLLEPGKRIMEDEGADSSVDSWMEDDRMILRSNLSADRIEPANTNDIIAAYIEDSTVTVGGEYMANREVEKSNDYLIRIHESRKISSPSVKLINSNLIVLLVDDSPMIRKLMSKFMTGLGHSTYDAGNGKEGIEKLEELYSEGINVDVILMDNQMPVMMGHEAVKHIRENMLYDGIILGVTGNLLEEDINQFKASGVDEIIMKPLTEESFNAAMTRKRIRKRNYKA